MPIPAVARHGVTLVGLIRTRSIISLACAATVVASRAVCPVAAEQDSDPAEAPRLFTLDRADTYLEFESEFNQRRVRYDGRGLGRGDARQQNRDWRVEERLGFSVAGSVIDPGFIAYRGEFSFGLSQNHYDEDSYALKQSDSDNGSLLSYDLSLDVLRGKPLSGTVYSLRLDDRINRRFQPTLHERRTGVGFNAYYDHPTLPMELSYDYLETDRTGNTRDRDDEHFTAGTFFYGLQWLISEDHHLKLSYEHADNKQEYQGSRRPFQTIRDLWILEDTLQFGGPGRHRLNTLVRWQEESGDFARDIFEFSPRLTLRHTDHLQTFLEYHLNREAYENIRVTQHRGEWQFVHQWYRNLTTTGHVFGLFEKTSDDVETTQYGAGIDWQYNRLNRYGRLYANLALAFDNEHVRGDNGDRLVLNESGTFRDPIGVTLRNRNVRSWGILVTDASDRRIYRPGLDYLVVRRGVWTVLVRVPNGRIADRQTVLVDYRYATPADGEIDTVRVDFGVEQRFEGGLTPYYRLGYRHQEVDDSTGLPVRPDRTDHHRIGVKYERDRYSLSAEYEIFDDVVEPYDAFHLDGRYVLLRTPDQQLEAAARFSRFFFEGGVDARDVTLLDLELDHRWSLSRSLSASSRAAYRIEDDSVDGDTSGVDLGTGISYAVGDLEVELSVEYDLLDLPRSKEDGFGVWLRVRRDFPNLFARR